MYPRCTSAARKRGCVLVLGIVTALSITAARAAPGGRAPTSTALNPAHAAVLMKRAMQHYSSRRFAAAASAYQRVLDLRTAPVATRHRAQFFQGKALYHLRLYASSLSRFEAIAGKGLSHRYFLASFIWFVAIQPHLPRPAGVLGSIHKYPETVLRQRKLSGVRDLARFFFGRAFYEVGNPAGFHKALAHFGKIPPKSRQYLPALLLSGLTWMRLGKPAKALERFKDVLRAEKRRRRRQRSNRERALATLARLNMARIFFQAAGKADIAARRIRRHRVARMRKAALKMLGLARKYYRSIPAGSPHWQQARGELAWVNLRLEWYRREWQGGDRSRGARAPGRSRRLVSRGFHRALADLELIDAPGLRNWKKPWRRYLEAILYFRRCRTAQATRSLDKLRLTLRPAHQALKKLTDSNQDDDNAFVAQVRSLLARHRVGLEPPMEAGLRRLWTSGPIREQRRWLNMLTREWSRVKRGGVVGRGSRLADSLAQDLSLRASLARAKLGISLRRQARDWQTELRSLLVRLGQVRYAIAHSRTYSMGRFNRSVKLPSQAAAATPYHRVELWSLGGDGYWQHEKAYHRPSLHNRCPRWYLPEP